MDYFLDTRADLDRGEISNDGKTWLLAMGLGTSILGILALITATLTTLVSVGLVGALFVFAALFQAVYAVTSGEWRGFGLHLTAAVLYAVTGFLLVGNPILGSEALTLLLGLLFFSTGVAKILGALALKFDAWGWALFSGCVSTVLGIWTLANFPLVSPFLVGTVVGIDLLFAGTSMVTLASSLRPFRRKEETEQPVKAA